MRVCVCMHGCLHVCACSLLFFRSLHYTTQLSLKRAPNAASAHPNPSISAASAYQMLLQVPCGRHAGRAHVFASGREQGRQGSMMLLVARHTSHLTPHTSHLTPHPSPIQAPSLAFVSSLWVRCRCHHAWLTLTTASCLSVQCLETASW